MKRLLLLTAALVGTSVSAEEITIFTGVERGGYDARARSIAARLEQRGHDVEVENRNGSDDITLQACAAGDAPVMWLAQKDALYRREMGDGCVLPDVALYGKEYALLFFPPNSRKDELSDLDNSDTVLIDKIGSGSELTWKTMVSVEQEHGRADDWSTAKLADSPYARATSMASRGTVSAVFMVRTLDSSDITFLLKSGWELGELWDKDLNDLKWNGSPLYEGEKVTIVRDGRRAARDWGYVIPSYIGTTASVEYDTSDLFMDMVNAAQ